METLKLKRFAQFARRSLMEQVSAKMKQVLEENSAARRERAEAIKKLEGAIKNKGKEWVSERVAYIWFNRFCALRFMDVNRYNRVNIVSPADPGQFQPEILAEAKMGHIDEEMVYDKVRHQVFALLDGKAPSRDPQGEAYRLLVVAACNFWNKAMPFLFQYIDDYTELLMPDDLLSGNSILAYTREAMTPDACEDVEVIGWLYQFYISEKKDEVFDGLKKNKKITPENIPAATQLFTPHWIVRYLVENSLGRLWLLNRPGSKLVEQMDYYIKPEQAETDFLRIAKPEEIKICDPACGSGHMLTYAFDLLYAIYEEEGYEPAEIPEKILTHNLYGIEIDERAGELAAFALTMKARAKQRRYFNKGVKPNICVLENVHFDERELKDYMDFVGRDLFTAPMQITLRQFEEADNFGSLIRPTLTDVPWMIKELESKGVSGQLFLHDTHTKAMKVLDQSDYLSPKYHVVVANPPYMGGKGMNGRLGAWAKDNYPNSKSDLFSMFIERNLDLAQKHGAVAMITMQSWMFLTTYEPLRENLLGKTSILSMAHLGARAFDSIGGEVVSTIAFVLEKANKPEYKGHYLRLIDGGSEKEKESAFRNLIDNAEERGFYRCSTEDFKKLPGSPIAYWASDSFRNIFSTNKPLNSIHKPRAGTTTTHNDRFLRLWHEVGCNYIQFNARSLVDARDSNLKWFPYNKGGGFRKYYGNNEYLLNWENDGAELKDWIVNHPVDPSPWSRYIRSIDYYFKPGISWGDVAGKFPSFRWQQTGYIAGSRGPMIFIDELNGLLAYLNSALSREILKFLNPTLTFNVGIIAELPFVGDLLDNKYLVRSTHRLVDISKHDWDSYETSWEFNSQPLLNRDFRLPTLKATYQKLRSYWREMTLEMQQLEEENNRIFIDAYGLQDELTPEVPLKEITLTCNPNYRYGNDKSEDELEALLLADTMRELVSYAVGCMFGRYALDKPGLILANQGETIEDYLRRVPEPSFPADDDNVIPMLDGDWFTDDIAERFRKFLRVAFGEEHYEENLKFVEKALGKNDKARDIRDYFLKDFYSDHVRRYKKRPIYWLFSSPKGSFNALIYMHRYRPDTVSVVLNDYLREFRTKLASHKNNLEAVSISGSSTPSEKTKALKEIEKVKKMITEMEEYERDVLYPLATKQEKIDLDDGVKVNYLKFGAALKKIPGLDVKED
jgi:type II restriction/modification system DNA methylase subunit YeeA